MSARFRVAVPLVAAALVASLLTVSGAASAAPVVAKKNPKTDKVILFASDGMRQDLIQKYASVMPTMAEFLKKGTFRDGERPADTSAAEHRCRVVLACNGRMAGRARVDEQHVPHQRAAVRELDQRVQPRRLQAESISSGRPSAAGSRSHRSSGPVAGRPASKARRSTSRRSSPDAASPRTSSVDPSHQIFDDPAFIQSFGLQFDHPAGIRRPGRRSRGAPPPATGWTEHCRRRSAPRWRCGCGCSTSAPTSTGSTRTSSTAPTTARTNYDKVLFSPTKDGSDSVGTLGRARWPT